MPSGSEPWAGLANEDASAYPFTFGDGGSITFTGSTDGSSADIYFRFEKNPYPDTEPSYNTEVVTLGAESSEYTVNVPSQEGNTFSSFLLYLSTPDVVVTLNNVAVNTSEYSGPVDVVGCMDSNASNYNADATVQGYDQYGNLQCVFASCDNIPDEEGCIYSDAYSPYNESFNAAACTSYGGTACTVEVLGCMDSNASNYNADATAQGYDQWGNLQCVYASCDDIPEYGCIYADGFGAFNEGFDGVACASYGGTPCEPAPACEGSLLTINMFDSYGDGGGSVTLAGVTATNSGASSATEVCVDLSACNTVDYEATDSWPYENAWSITDADGNELASGFDADGLVGNCVSGCSDETAENYNADADIADDSLCEYALVQGCMDETACNYDSAAEQDNGSCTYAAEGFDCAGNCLSGDLLTMNDSYGDGWNGAVLTINGVDYTIEWRSISYSMC